MEKFTKMKVEEKTIDKDNSLFKNDTMKIIKYDNMDIILSNSIVVILPYLKDEGYILLNYEKLPAFNFKYKNVSEFNNIDYYLSCIKSEHKEDETDSQNVRRILHERTGIVLNNMYTPEIIKVLFKTDNDTGQYHICIVDIGYNDYKQTSIHNDEKQIVKIGLGDLDDLKTYDLITDYLILKLKYENNMK